MKTSPKERSIEDLYNFDFLEDDLPVETNLERTEVQERSTPPPMEDDKFIKHYVRSMFPVFVFCCLSGRWEVLVLWIGYVIYLMIRY